MSNLRQTFQMPLLAKLSFFIIAYFLTSCNTAHPSKKNVLRLNIFSEPPCLDPRKAADTTSINVLLNLFEGLTRLDEEGCPHPALAKVIDISDDKCTYTFTLRNARWSNGEKVKAEDFLYAWQTALDPQFSSPFADKLYVIKNAEEIKKGKLPPQALGAQALNENVLQITLKHPTPYFLELTAFSIFYPVNRAIEQKFSSWACEATHYVSNGPFQLIKWDHDNEILAVKNVHYWDKASVNLETVHLAMVDEITTEFHMFEMDELDWAGSPLSNLPPEFISAIQQNPNHNLGVHFYPVTAVYYYKLNTNRYPLQNIHIRNALGLSINRDEIVHHVTQGGQSPALALVPTMPGWGAASVYFKDGDAERAKKLFNMGLEELNLSIAEFPRLTLAYNTNREHEKIAQAIQQQWKETLGIEVQLVQSDWKAYLSKICNQDYEICRVPWIGDFQDPISFLAPFKHKNNPNTCGNNDTGWEHPLYTASLDAASQELDLNKRATHLRKAEEILISEMPIIPIYYITQAYLKKPDVHGVILTPLGTADFKKAYKAK